MRLLSRAALVVVGLLAAACTQAVTTPLPDLAAEERAVRDADARWLKAAQTKDAVADGAALADDGVAYREHVDPIVGPAAYQAFEAKWWADNPKASVNWTTDSLKLMASADFAVETGSYALSGLGPKGDGEDKGRYVTVWKKVRGEWKVAYDIGSSTMPAAPAAKTTKPTTTKPAPRIKKK